MHNDNVENTPCCMKPYNEFEDTVQMMLSDDYKARFCAEYRQTKIRYERLKRFNTVIEAGNLMAAQGRKDVNVPKHDCPEHLLREQQAIMGQYLHLLEVRAEIEGIAL